MKIRHSCLITCKLLYIKRHTRLGGWIHGRLVYKHFRCFNGLGFIKWLVKVFSQTFYNLKQNFCFLFHSRPKGLGILIYMIETNTHREKSNKTQTCPDF